MTTTPDHRSPLVLLREEEGALGYGLREAGFHVAHCPVTETHPLPVAAEDVEGASLLALSSPRTLRMLPASVLRALRSVPTIAVGPVTARAATDAGLTVVGVGDDDARALAALAPQPAEPDQVALALGSARARPTLADGLVAKGWQVRVVPAYDTVTRTEAPAAGSALAAHDVPPGALVVATASSQVTAWFALGGRTDVRWIVIGEPTAATLRECGAEPLLVPAHPHDLLDTITASLDPHGTALTTTSHSQEDPS